MKRAIFVITIIIITITFGIIELHSVSNVLTQMEKHVDALTTEYQANEDNITPLVSDVDDFKDFWEHNENWLCYIFNHRDLSTITDSINRLKANTQNNDYDSAYSELALLKEYSTKSHHIMGFNIHNIL